MPTNKLKKCSILSTHILTYLRVRNFSSKVGIHIIKLNQPIATYNLLTNYFQGIAINQMKSNKVKMSTVYGLKKS